MTNTGRPWDEIEDTMTWPRVAALCAHWRESPPVGELAASVLGVKPKEKKQGSIEEIMSLFEGGALR